MWVLAQKEAGHLLSKMDDKKFIFAFIGLFGIALFLLGMQWQAILSGNAISIYTFIAPIILLALAIPMRDRYLRIMDRLN